MQIHKNFKIPALILFFLFSLLLPAGETLAQGAPPIPTDIPVGCNDITVGQVCGVDIDSDGIDDIEITNEGLDAQTNKPKLKTRSLKVKSIGGKQFIESPGIANYIASIYKYAVGLVTILTTIMIIISGVMWTTSAGNLEQISKSKQMITRSLTGLIIALGSYTLLYTINPDLVQFRALQVMRIEGFAAEIPDDYTIPTSPNANVGTLTDLAELTGIPNLTAKPGVDTRVTSETRMALAAAMEQFKGYNVGSATINFAVRTPAQQYNLLSKMVGCGCKPIEILFPLLKKENITKVTGDEWKKYCAATLNTSACPASYKTLTLENGVFKAPLIGHFGGTALDISASKTGSHKACGGPAADPKETTSKGVVNAGAASGDSVCIPMEQQKLIKAMLDNGFCVALAGSGSARREPWHFELGSGSAGWCTSDPSNLNLLKLEYFQDLTKN